MSNLAIRVENLGKMYRIGGKQEKYSTLRDTLVDVAAAPFRKVRGLLRGESAGRQYYFRGMEKTCADVV